MTLGRRAFLQRFGIGVVVAPAAAKQVFDKGMADLAGINLAGAGGFTPPPYGPPGAGQATKPTSAYNSVKALQKLLQTPELRAQYESLMFEHHRNVGPSISTSPTSGRSRSPPRSRSSASAMWRERSSTRPTRRPGTSAPTHSSARPRAYSLRFT